MILRQKPGRCESSNGPPKVIGIYIYLHSTYTHICIYYIYIHIHIFSYTYIFVSTIDPPWTAGCSSATCHEVSKGGTALRNIGGRGRCCRFSIGNSFFCIEDLNHPRPPKVSCWVSNKLPSCGVSLFRLLRDFTGFCCAWGFGPPNWRQAKVLSQMAGELCSAACEGAGKNVGPMGLPICASKWEH